MSKVIYINLGSGYESKKYGNCSAYRKLVQWLRDNPNAKIVHCADFRKDYKNATKKFVFMYYPYLYNRIPRQKHIYGKAIIE